jgi:hypothetical protein
VTSSPSSGTHLRCGCCQELRLSSSPSPQSHSFRREEDQEEEEEARQSGDCQISGRQKKEKSKCDKVAGGNSQACGQKDPKDGEDSLSPSEVE